jgi:outer membrane protein assembly factor BamE (lipoprotein component of BamABCDE complex)
VPGRGITLGFDNDILVSHNFQSSFKEDNSEFDESKATQIVKGKTTKEEIRQLFGRPSGEQIFPFARTPKGISWVYGYSHFRNTRELNRRTYRKGLAIYFTEAGVVEDYELATDGDKF